MTRIDHLKSFCLVAELHSFSLAAESIGVSQPALSQQVKALEEEYQTELVHRKGNRISLTEDGRQVYDYALKIIALYDRSIEEVLPHKKKLNGALLIGASSGPGEFPVPVLMGIYKRQHPEVNISLKVGDTNEIIEMVLNQSLEMGFVGNQRRDSHLIFQPFFDDEMVLVISPNHPFAKKKRISLEEFLTIPLILQQQGAGVRETFLDALKAQGVNLSDLNIFLELGLQDSVKSAVKAGFGGTVISKLGGVGELESGRLVAVSVEDLDFSRPQMLCINRMMPLSNIASDFIKFAGNNKERVISDYLSRLN